MKDKIACVILNYNDAGNVIELVGQLEPYQIVDHIIVVDNASPDGSLERLTPLASDKVTVCGSGKNGGYGYGNNYGLKIAKERFDCKYAFIINSDVRCSEECLRAVLACFERYPKCGVASAMQMLSDGTMFREVAWSIPSAARYIRTSLFLLSHIWPIKKTDILHEYEKVECVAGSFLCVDTEKFFLVGGYDENIFLNCEETTLGIRMKENGFEEYVLKDVYYEHFHNTGSISMNLSIIRSKKLLLKSRLYVIRTYLTRSKAMVGLARVCFVISMVEEWAKVPVRYVTGLLRK